MTKREARDLLDLHELIQWGRVSLEDYARIRRVRSDDPANWERSARRLVARLRALGYHVRSLGDDELLELDLSVDRHLRAEVERWIDRVSAELSSTDPDPEDSSTSAEAIVLDWDRGLSVEVLCERHRIHESKLRAILRATGRTPRPARRPRLEERRAPAVVAAALQGCRGVGYIARVAKALGCSWPTARRLLLRRAPAGTGDRCDGGSCGRGGGRGAPTPRTVPARAIGRTQAHGGACQNPPCQTDFRNRKARGTGPRGRGRDVPS